MQGSRGIKVIMTFWAVSAVSQASETEPSNKVPIQREAVPTKADCAPTQALSSVVSNTSNVDQSIRTGNRSYSTNSSNTLNKPSTTPMPASVTVSNSCELSRATSPDTATSAALTAALLHLAGKAEKEQKDSGDAWKALEKLAPVFQTLIWAVLIVCLTRRFARPIIRLLRTLGNRMEKLHIKTPFGELFADIRPLPEDRQTSRAAEEASPPSANGDSSARASTSSGIPESSDKPLSHAGAIRMYYEAEDFVIRTLQQEFGTSIAQNVQTATGIEMDGFFTSNDTPHVIEVKLVRSFSSSGPLRDALARLVTRLKQEKRFEQVRVIMALVYIEDLPHAKQRKIEAMLFGIDPTVQVRWFSLDELRRRFKVVSADGDRS